MVSVLWLAICLCTAPQASFVNIDDTQCLLFAVCGPTVLGMERATAVMTVITVILVPLLLAIFKVWLTRKWRDKLRVRIAPTLNDKQFQELSALYCERVPDYERVPPNHFSAFFRREYSAKSIRDFRDRISRDNVPVHLLFVGQTAQDICGFLKAIYVPGVHCLFIAYLVATKRGTHEERTVTQKLLTSLFAACQKSAVQSVVFEICVHPESKHAAKARLFRHYASAHGLRLRRIDAKYQQPEICSFEAGDCNVTDAGLYIAYMEAQTRDTRHSISLDDYRRLVVAIYKNVYLMSYALSEPQLVTRYQNFLQQLARMLFATTKEGAVDLK